MRRTTSAPGSLTCRTRGPGGRRARRSGTRGASGSAGWRSSGTTSSTTAARRTRCRSPSTPTGPGTSSSASASRSSWPRTTGPRPASPPATATCTRLPAPTSDQVAECLDGREVVRGHAESSRGFGVRGAVVDEQAPVRWLAGSFGGGPVDPRIRLRGPDTGAADDGVLGESQAVQIGLQSGGRVGDDDDRAVAARGTEDLRDLVVDLAGGRGPGGGEFRRAVGVGGEVLGDRGTPLLVGARAGDRGVQAERCERDGRDGSRWDAVRAFEVGHGRPAAE